MNKYPLLTKYLLSFIGFCVISLLISLLAYKFLHPSGAREARKSDNELYRVLNTFGIVTYENKTYMNWDMYYKKGKYSRVNRLDRVNFSFIQTESGPMNIQLALDRSDCRMFFTLRDSDKILEAPICYDPDVFTNPSKTQERKRIFLDDVLEK